MVENRRPIRPEPIQAEPVPDLTALMNDWFFGTANNSTEIKPSNINEVAFINEEPEQEEEEEQGSYSPRNNNSRLTQEWLQEAKRVVASSPSRCDSPARLVGSPRFATARIKDMDRRDPLSRSARRHRAVESFSNEILSKSAKHSRNRSETFNSQPTQWFSNMLKPHTPDDSPRQQTPQDSSEDDLPVGQINPTKPPRQPIRRSRFREVNTTAPQSIPSKRIFKPPAAVAALDMQLLSPPKNLIESTHRKSISVSTCSLSENKVLSPPRNLVETAHRRSISSSTCSIDKISTKTNSVEMKESGDVATDLNAFLKEQKFKVKKISSGEIKSKAKIVLSGSSNSTSSMVAAICYAWLLHSKIKDNKEEGHGAVVVPVMNMRRGRMWKQRQVAWLFHHVGIDATSLLFSDEVDLENLMMVGRLSIMVVGQDILKTNNEVGSQCTILTDNYCEDAYDMLQIPVVKKLLLAGILLDTQNLNLATKVSMNRDTEAVQLLLVGSAPNYNNALFDQLTRNQRDSAFLEAMRQNYGKPPNESGNDNGALVENRVSVRKSTSIGYQGLLAPTSDKNSNDAKPMQTSGNSHLYILIFMVP
ncbi:hypothetical protein AQUCO_05600005v1 [Aquilegia coerulea]|uniref:DHHA2 domain-containing protein n=1 Tax=Aquilegia coerulea TaxID=218851 RepID=A0A2G5CG95_AQUCA|nr:hypothetical protein AQUCO_05600005v1 [Aquilegia coerulea]